MLKFRNLSITPDDPVEKWGVEEILCTFERGYVDDWGKIWKSIHTDKSQKVIDDVAQVKKMLGSNDLGYAIAQLF